MNKIALLMAMSITLLMAENRIEMVEIAHSGSDPIGSTLAFKVKEEVRNSSGWNLYYGIETHFVIQLNTMDLKKPRAGENSVLSVSLLLQAKGEVLPYYLNGTVGYSGSESLEEVAINILSTLDDEVDTLFKLLNVPR
jgi:hypothetical protein